MQVTSLLSQHEHDDQHDDSCGCGHDHEHSVVHLWQAVLGVVFVLNAYIVDWLFESSGTLASASAFIGAVILGYPIVVTAIKDLRVGRLSINELVAIAVLAAFASGNYKTAGVVAFFMLMGEIIETRTAEGARDSIESLIKLTPTKARRITKDGNEEEVAASELNVGDIIRIRPGDNVAADGIIVSGQGSFNQATITGESLPADKKSGDEVFAGTQNLTGVLEIKVSRAGTDTTLGRVRELIIAAEKTKLPIQKIVDQYMGFYTPLVLVIGALVWAFTHQLDPRHRRVHRVVPVRVHSRDADRDGRRAVRRRAFGNFDQERRRHRSSPRKSTRLFSTKPERSRPASSPSAGSRPSATRNPPNCCCSPRPPKNTATIRLPRRSRRSRAKPEFRSPNQKILPKPPVAA